MCRSLQWYYRVKVIFMLRPVSLNAAGERHRSTAQVSLTGGLIFQMDQTVRVDQSILRHNRECGKDSNPDRHFDIRSRRQYKKQLEIDQSLFSIL